MLLSFISLLHTLELHVVHCQVEFCCINTQSVCSFYDHLICFLFLALKNKMTMKICVHVFCLKIITLSHISKKETTTNEEERKTELNYIDSIT